VEQVSCQHGGFNARLSAWMYVRMYIHTLLQSGQVFLDTWYQNVPNQHKKVPNVLSISTLSLPKVFPMSINYFNISNLRPSKIYPNWDFWFENKPSGNLALLSDMLPVWLRKFLPIRTYTYVHNCKCAW
jgi:hypothetical protein